MLTNNRRTNTMSRAHANIALMSAQALARNDSGLSDRVDYLENLFGSLKENPAFKEALIEAEAEANEASERAKAEVEAQRKAAESAARSKQVEALKAQLAQFEADGYGPEAVAQSLSPESTS